MGTTEEARHAALRRGFTLVEAMVVTAIIGILASLMLPVLRGAKETAHSVVCKNSLRQRILGTQFFVNDFGKYPVGLSEVETLLAPQASWGFCPTVEHDPRRLASCCGAMSAFGDDYLYNSGGTERYNYALPDQSDTKVYLGLGGIAKKAAGGKWTVSRLPESRVVAPASMIALTHMVTAPMFNSGPLGFGGPAYYENPFLNGGPLHRGGENAAFTDGHVGSKNSDLIPTTTNRFGHVVFQPDATRARHWNHDNQPHPETWPEN